MIGQVILGRYVVMRPLGEGAMGKVYLARQRDNGRQVVVKVMREQFAAEPKFRDLFEREMNFMARFQHPNVVALYDCSTKGPHGLCIVMEYVPGTDMERLLRTHRRLDEVRTGKLLAQLCSALQAAHNEGIVHRDLKPANLMIVDPDYPKESLKVMDFGLAKLAGTLYIPLERLQHEGPTIATGTAEYMAPEQVRGDELDHRGDIYSVGIILYEMLTGRLPFRHEKMDDLLLAHEGEPPPSFAGAGCSGLVRPDVEAVVQACLAKYPNERPQTAWELAERYEEALGEKILDGVAPPPKESPKPAAPPVVVKHFDRHATVNHLEAWMPERIAVVKLRGFVQDAHGDVLESAPGLIRVRFGGPGCVYQVPVGGREPAPAPKKAFGWFGRSAAKEPAAGLPIELELHMEKKEAQTSVLQMTMVLRPEGGGAPPPGSAWTDCCDRIYRDLRAYLMCK